MFGIGMDGPLSYSIDVPTRKVIVTYAAQPTFAQWAGTMDEIFIDPNFHPGFGVLLDRRAVILPAETDYVKRMVGFIDKRRDIAGPGRWAILVSDPGSFGMGRMAGQLSSCEYSIRVFRELAEASAWLAGHGA